MKFREEYGERREKDKETKVGAGKKQDGKKTFSKKFDAGTFRGLEIPSFRHQ